FEVVFRAVPRQSLRARSKWESAPGPSEAIVAGGADAVRKGAVRGSRKKTNRNGRGRATEMKRNQRTSVLEKTAMIQTPLFHHGNSRSLPHGKYTIEILRGGHPSLAREREEPHPLALLSKLPSVTMMRAR